MIKGRIIVCIANSWDYDPTSKHHIMKLLSRHNDIVWINYHGTRRPKVTRADLRHSLSALGRVVRGLDQVAPSIVQLTPLVVPGASHPSLQRLHERLLVSQIRKAVRAVDKGRQRPLQVWSFAPDVPYLAGRLDEECFVYYCVDEHSKFEGVDTDRIAAAEEETIRRADVVITSSQALFDSKRTINPDAVLVRHGVDYDHFASAWRDALPCPADLTSIPQPMLGFFGMIHHWIDVRLIAAVARLRPQYSFVLIGDRLVDVSALESLPNVFLLGRRPHAQLPAYCARFSAGLMPFERTEMTRNVNPIKMYEYLAAGLPIISTSLPEAQRVEEFITIADTPDDFAVSCDRVLAADYHDRREAISKVVEHESWLSKVEHLSAVIQERIPACAPTPPVSASQDPQYAAAI